MDKDEQILKSHILDLARVCYERDIPTSSDFLNLAEQTFIESFLLELPPVFVNWNGGYDASERKRMEFTSKEARCSHLASLCVMKITPLGRKFSEPLTHRDYLGALLNLGISRGKVGDLIVLEEGCLFFCLPSVREPIVEDLCRVRHTAVRCEEIPGEDFVYEPSYQKVTATVSSMRLDCVIAAAFHLSRKIAADLIADEKAAVNSRIRTSTSEPTKEGDILSVRGYGKFRIDQARGSTRKGRIPVTLLIYK